MVKGRALATQVAKKKGVFAASEESASEESTSPVKKKVKPDKSPKSSPKAAPTTSAADVKLAERRKSKKDKLKEENASAKTAGDKGKPEISAADKEVAAKRAHELIKTALKDANCQANGFPFIPKDWSTEFKPILGSYMRFVEKCEGLVLIQGDRPGKFTVQVTDGVHVKPTPEWEVKLRNTWQVYLHETKKDEREPIKFVEVAMRLAGVKGDAGPPEQESVAEDGGKQGAKRKQVVASKAEEQEPAAPKKKKKKSTE